MSPCGLAAAVRLMKVLCVGRLRGAAGTVCCFERAILAVNDASPANDNSRPADVQARGVARSMIAAQSVPAGSVP